MGREVKPGERNCGSKGKKVQLASQAYRTGSHGDDDGVKAVNTFGMNVCDGGENRAPEIKGTPIPGPGFSALPWREL